MELPIIKDNSRGPSVKCQMVKLPIDHYLITLLKWLLK
jgi:hypothetical protein